MAEQKQTWKINNAKTTNKYIIVQIRPSDAEIKLQNDYQIYLLIL